MRSNERPSELWGMVRRVGFWLVLGAAIAAVVAGRFIAVHVPREECIRELAVCAGDSQVNEHHLRWAAKWWSARGYHVSVVSLSPFHPCDLVVKVDPTIDTRASVDDTTTVVEQVSRSAGVMLVLEGQPMEIYAHGIGHALGLGHPFAAPSGHVMNFRNPGLDDRGVEAVPCP